MASRVSRDLKKIKRMQTKRIACIFILSALVLTFVFSNQSIKYFPPDFLHVDFQLQPAFKLF